MKKLKKIFIDGSSGTTGLEISQKIKSLKNIQLITIPLRHRKNLNEKIKCYNQADLVVLCLPDEGAKEAMEILKNLPQVKVLDTSTAHRTQTHWVYGFPELKGQKKLIQNARWVANPGCYAIAFIALIRPLIEQGVLSQRVQLSCFGVSGFSGGGRKMIANYQKSKPAIISALRDTIPDRSITSEKSSSSDFTSAYSAHATYALDLEHKHLMEMQKITGLTRRPIFIPAVAPVYRGMLVGVPIHFSQLKWKSSEFFKNKINFQSTDLSRAIKQVYQHYYAVKSSIKVRTLSTDKLEQGRFLNFTANNYTDNIDILISTRGNGDVYLQARLDNLGKGASGNAIQNIKLILGL